MGGGTAAGDLPENVACALAYAFGPLSGVLLLVLEPYSVNMRIRFHAMQSLFVSGALFVLWFALLLVSAIMLLVPFAGAILGSLMLAIFGLAVLALWGEAADERLPGQDVEGAVPGRPCREAGVLEVSTRARPTDFIPLRYQTITPTSGLFLLLLLSAVRRNLYWLWPGATAAGEG